MSYIFETKNLSIKHGSKIAIDDLSLKLNSGKIIGLLGPNGAGKTTLLKTAMKMIPISSGKLLIDGKSPSEDTKQITSYLPDRLFFDEKLSVTKTLDLFKDYFNDFDYDKAASMIEDLGVDKTSKIKDLSKGMKEKLQISLIMSRDAKLYLLDEPLAAVDAASRQYILDTIINNYKEDATIIISTHLIHDIEKVLDEVIFINNGKLLFHDETDNIRERQNRSIEDYFKEVFNVKYSS